MFEFSVQKYIRNRHFSSLDRIFVGHCYGIIFWGSTSSMHKVLLRRRRGGGEILRTVFGISSRSSGRKWFKKLEILPIPSLYIYSLLLTTCITFEVIPLFTRLIQDIRIIYIYLQLDFLQYREVLLILLLRYSTNYHPEF
jgi:hypothetical protein